MSKRKRPKRCPTDLNARKWNVIRERLPTALPGGRPRQVNLRKVINAILYIGSKRLAWHLLPMGRFPPHQTVYGCFRCRVVEQTFAWLHRYRRLSKDYEVCTDPWQSFYPHRYD